MPAKPVSKGPVPDLWRWPVSATPTRAFGKGNKGLDFELAVGTVVTAAAAGSVVYSGAGLGGYETLVIVRHTGGYLSAYSLHGPAERREGDSVKLGDRVAVIRASGRAAALHFEIRRDGDPVNPAALLPSR
ncbi:MAG: peptidoglycan DD-metalloendopeptidase family protein [Pseudomonadales bacterium]